MQFLKIINPHHWAREWLVKQDLAEGFISPLTITIDVLVLVLIALAADWIAKKIVFVIIKRIVAKSKTKWDDYFYQQRVFKNLVHLIPAIIILLSIESVFEDVPRAIPFLKKTVELYIILLIVIVINKALKAFENLMINDEKWANSPLRTLSQVSRILIFFVALVFVISILTGVQAGNILGILAGTSAILILIFQDTINGLLANLQITMYDLLRVGDWVTLSKFGVDGDVIAIDLTTVKIRNFDKTISSVPAKAFVNDSFVNWRGMKEAQGRRIMRNISIDISSVRFCTDQDIAAFAQVAIVKEYVLHKQEEIDAHNHTHRVNEPLQLNGRTQTNIGVYRNYVLNYLKNHPNVDPNFTMMVRQLQSTSQGVPIEVYCFANTTIWTKYEGIQADIFDHLYAATSFFGLRLYQAPSGSDFQTLTRTS